MNTLGSWAEMCIRDRYIGLRVTQNIINHNLKEIIMTTSNVNSVAVSYTHLLIREIICAASLPRPFRMQRRGSLRTLSALAAILIAASAAANDS